MMRGSRSAILIIQSFILKTSSDTVILVIYVDDILLAESNVVGIVKGKEYLKTQFVIKDMGKPRYFLGLKLFTVNME